VFGVGGAVILLVAAIRLVTEAKLALEGLHDETAFLQHLSNEHYNQSKIRLDEDLVPKQIDD
jgi:hypothetical protein